MEDFKINVLGTEYNVIFRSANEDSFLKSCSGYIDKTVKKIVIENKKDDCEIEDFDYLQKQTCRHEIVHAFMEESGLSNDFEHKSIGIEETMVDWIAIQFPKMKKVFEEHNLL